MSSLIKLLEESFQEDLENSHKLEEEYFLLKELTLDPSNTYSYREVSYVPFTRGWSFFDRCGNEIVAVYIPSIQEFKTGYKVEGINTLVFQPEKTKTLGHKIKTCPDDKRVNTVFKILVEEVIPTFLLSKKPNKLLFNPVSPSRERLVQIIIAKILKQYPQLTKHQNYLIYK